MPFRTARTPRPLDDSASSDAVLNTARQRLRDTGYVPLRVIDCWFDAGSLVLRGRVPSYYLKQLAQEVVRGATGVRGIVNEIEVEGQHRKPAK